MKAKLLLGYEPLLYCKIASPHANTNSTTPELGDYYVGSRRRVLNWCLIFSKSHQNYFLNKGTNIIITIIWRTFHRSLSPFNVSLECTSRMPPERELEVKALASHFEFHHAVSYVGFWDPLIFHFLLPFYCSFLLHAKKALGDLGDEIGPFPSHERQYRLWSQTTHVHISIWSLIMSQFSHL